MGVTPEELREVMYLTAPFIGFPRMLNAVAAVNEVFKDRGVPLPLEKQGTVTESNRHETGKAIQDKLYPGGIASVMKGLPGDIGKRWSNSLRIISSARYTVVVYSTYRPVNC